MHFMQSLLMLLSQNKAHLLDKIYDLFSMVGTEDKYLFNTRTD